MNPSFDKKTAWRRATSPAPPPPGEEDGVGVEEGAAAAETCACVGSCPHASRTVPPPLPSPCLCADVRLMREWSGWLSWAGIHVTPPNTLLCAA